MNLFIDIETIPDQRPDALDRARELVKAPANYKKPEAIEKYKNDNAADLHAKTGLNGLYGEICSIAWAFDSAPVRGIVRDHDMPEAELLTNFFEMVESNKRPGEGEYQRLMWIGHNVIDFDLRFLKQRAIVNRVMPPFAIPADTRHNGAAFDTMKEWAGWRGYVSLDALCEAFGIEGKGDIDGSMVGQLWADGKFQTIVDYNIADVEKTRSVYQRMIWQ